MLDHKKDPRMADYSQNDCSYPSLFGEAQVFNVEASDGTPLRMLYIGDGFQSATYVGPRRFEPPFAYCRAFDRLFDMKPNAQRILMIGGGAFSYPKHLLTTHPEVTLDVVEIDPTVIEIARKHFFLDELEKQCGDHLHVYACDGLDFLRTVEPGTYDVIINDSFAGIVQDEPLLSDEGMRLAQRALAIEGVYMLNGLAENADDPTDWETLDRIKSVLDFYFFGVVRESIVDQEFFDNVNHLFIGRQISTLDVFFSQSSASS